MSENDDENRLSGKNTGERGPILSRVLSLVPLLDLILRVLEIILKVLRII
jgi:hypothetical protein